MFRYRILRSYRNTPIAKKIMLLNTMLVMIPFLLLGYSATRSSSKMIIEKSVEGNVQNIALIRQTLEDNIVDVQYLADAIIADKNLQYTMIIHEDEGNENRMSYASQTKDYIDNMIKQKKIVGSAEVWMEDGQKISSSSAVYVGTVSTSYDSWDKDYPDKGVWRESARTVDSETSHVSTVISYQKNVFRGTTGRYLGRLFLNISGDAITDLFSGSGNNDSSDYFIVNGEGFIVFSEIKSLTGNSIINESYYEWIKANDMEGEIFNTDGEERLVTSGHMKEMDWYIVGMTPLNTILEDSYKIAERITVFGIFYYGIALVLLGALSRLLTNPIVKLSKAVADMDDGLELDFSYEGVDEIGLLTDSFNGMTQRIRVLMKRIYDEQKSKRTYEFLALQAQINPHFLYNTLDSACSLIKMDMNDEAFKMIKSLGVFYRTSLSKGRNMISLEEELLNINSYLTIQKIRYGNKVNYTMDVDEALQKQKILKLTIQPILENAIYHGIRKRPGSGNIHLAGTVESDCMLLKITDDGVGMNRSVIDAILSEGESDEKKKSFGLRSVHERIRLYFGKNYGLEIKSVPGDGTVVSVKLPLSRELEVE